MRDPFGKPSEYIETKRVKVNESLVIKEMVPGSVPTPLSGNVSLFASNNQIVAKNATGSLVTVSNSTETNPIPDPCSAVDVSPWDQTVMFDGMELTRLASNGPLAPLIPTGVRISGGMNAGWWAARPFTMPKAYGGQSVRLSWYQTASYTTPDWRVEVWNTTTNTRVPLSTENSSGESLIPGTSGKYETTFFGIGQNDYTIRFVQNNAFAANLEVTKITVEPTNIIAITPQQGPTNYTPTFNTGVLGAGSSKFWWTRDGELGSVYLEFIGSGAGTAGSGVYEISLPFTVNTTRVGTGALGIGNIGNAILSLGGGTPMTGTARLNGAGTSVSIILENSVTSMGSWTEASAYNLGVANLRFSIKIVGVPVVGWESLTTGSLVDVDYAFNTSVTDANDTSAFGYGSNGTPCPGSTFTTSRQKRVRFRSPIQPTDVITFEVNAGGGWFELIGSGTAVNYGLVGLTLQNATMYGAGIVNVVNSTDVDVRFGQYASSTGTTYGSAGSNWSATTATVRWRLKKYSGGQVTGVGPATATRPGVVSVEEQAFKGIKSFIDPLIASKILSSSTGSTARIEMDAALVAVEETWVPNFGTSSGGIFLVTISGASNAGTLTALFVGGGSGAPTSIWSGSSVTMAKTNQDTASRFNIFAPQVYNFSLKNRTTNPCLIVALKFAG